MVYRIQFGWLTDRRLRRSWQLVWANRCRGRSASTYPWRARDGSVGDEHSRPRRGCVVAQQDPVPADSIGLSDPESLRPDRLRLDEADASRRDATYVLRVGRSRTRALSAAYPGRLQPPVSDHGTWC